MSNFPLDPTKPIVNLADTRLQKLFILENYKYATLFEYSKATGINSNKLLPILEPYIASGELSIDALGGELFLNTRPELNNPQVTQIPPNLWEILRDKGDEEMAFNLWTLIRDMESGGWVIEAEHSKNPVASTGERSLLSLKIKTMNFPIVILPTMYDLGNPAGVLTKFLLGNNRLIALVVKNIEVEEASTMVRKWILSRPHRVDVTILILPEPRYQPIIITSKDQSLTPVTVTREYLDTL